jgi:hypothetical protein
LAIKATIMRNTFLKIILLICSLVKAEEIQAQLLPVLQNAFNNHAQKLLNEKLFVHTDKDAYVVGELIWFKLYNVDASTNCPSSISKIAYVEVLDRQNNPVLQAKINLINGSGSGSFDLPLTLKSGRYKFRSYTSFMQNQGATAFFEKPITLYNPQDVPEKQTILSRNIDLQFFPEGGNFVEGLVSKIGFRAIDSEGKGVSLEGAIVDSKNDTVARFKTLKFGNGQFNFTPIAGRIYKAVALTEDREVLIKDLPIVNKQGVTMRLDDIGNGQLAIKIQTNTAAPKVYIFVHQEKKTSIAIESFFENKVSTFTFEEKNLPEGISYITVFNDKGVPICERLYFKQPTRVLQIMASTDLEAYNVRQKVTVKVASKNEKNELIPANLSLSIHRLDSLQLTNQNDINTYFWLSSVLKGNFESPEYYINNRTNESQIALENLLLTQGWRKFDWENALNNEPASLKFLPEYNGHIIKGILKDVNGIPKINTLIYMGIPGKRLQFYSSKTDETGNFLFNTKDLYGANEVVVQTNFREDSTSKISILSPFSEEYTNTSFNSATLIKELVKQLEQTNLETQVMLNFSGKQLKQFYLPEVDTTDFFQTYYKSYLLKDYTTFNTLEDVIREYVRETLVSKKNNNSHLTVVGETKYLNPDPLLLMDGVPRFDFNKLLTINPNVIEKLEVVRNRYYYGTTVAEGILKFTTYQGKLQTVPIDPNAVVIDYEGVQLQRKFYAPVYETIEQKNSRVPDFRNLLYWLPNLTTTEKEETEFNLYTSDQTGVYLVVIQGFTAQGLAGSKTFTFQVKK